MHERVRTTIRDYARSVDPRRLGGDYSVVSLCALGLVVAITVGVIEHVTTSVTPFTVGLAGGATLALAVRLLAADRTAAMPIGGAAAPIGTAVALAAPAVWGLQSGLLSAGIVAAGVVLGFGCGLVVAQSFADGRVQQAASRLVIATVFLSLGAIVVVAVLAGEIGALVDVVTEITTALARELGATSRPLSAAGPTLLIAAAGLIAASIAAGWVSMPSVLTDETKATVRAALDRWARGLRWAGLFTLVLGAVITPADATGVLSAFIAAAPPVGVILTAVGSASIRALAVGLVLLSVGALLAIAVLRRVRALTLQQVTVATLPTIGLVAGGVAITATLLTVPAIDIEALARAAPPLSLSEGLEGVAVMVGFGAVFISAALVTGLYLLQYVLPDRTLGFTLTSISVAAAGIVVLVTTSSFLAGFGLFALAVFVADVGAYGWTVGSEVGRRSGARMEVLHALASALVGAIGVAVALSLVGIATAGGPALSPLNYALGAAAVVVVFLTVGRQLSEI